MFVFFSPEFPVSCKLWSLPLMNVGSMFHFPTHVLCFKEVFPLSEPFCSVHRDVAST